MPARRFEAQPETIVRDLAVVLNKLEATEAHLVTATKVTKAFTDLLRRIRVGVRQADPLTLAPPGCALTFQRAGQPYHFQCGKWPQLIDNVRACQLAVTRLYQVYEDYGVTRNEADAAEAEASFHRLFGGHLALGDGGDPPWWQVLGVSPAAPPPVIKAAYLALVKVHHPDNQTGDQATFVRVQRAYEAATSLAAR